MLAPRKTSGTRKRSVSIEGSREEKKFAKRDTVSKAATPASAKQTTAPAAQKVDLGAAGKTAKQKLKNLKSKQSNMRLARLEKMYQELTEIEAKTALGQI